MMPSKDVRSQERRDIWHVCKLLALLALIAGAAWITWGAMPTELQGH